MTKCATVHLVEAARVHQAVVRQSDHVAVVPDHHHFSIPF